ncbi:MAG: hypothetical protein WCO68_00420 [Verrucomicrobiota bacterium]
MKLLRNLVILVVLLCIIGVGVAFFSINALVKKGFETAGPAVAKVETRLGSANILPFSGTGKLSDIFVGNPQGCKTPHAIKVASVSVGVNLPSLKTDTVTLHSVKIEAPDICIEGGLTDKNNLTAIVHNIDSFAGNSSKPKADEAKKSADSGKKVIVKDLLITGAKVHWVSPMTLGQEVLLQLPDIHLQNIGEEKKGITLGALSKLIMDEIFKASGAVSKQNLNKAVDQIKELGKGNLNNAADKLKGLFH